MCVGFSLSLGRACPGTTGLPVVRPVVRRERGPPVACQRVPYPTKGRRLPYEVRSVSHTGLTVSDLDEALRFWTEVLGFESLGSGEFGARSWRAALACRGCTFPRRW